MAAVKRSLNLGMVGVGRIGGPVLMNLAFKSRNAMYLQVHSRSRAKANAMVDKLQRDGAQSAFRVHDNYASLTKWCDVIVSCLADDAVTRSVMLERDDALLRNAKKGQIIIDHSTVGIDTARECASVAEKAGAFYLDAPMSGTKMHAKNGQLTVMVGGDARAFEKVQAILRLYGENLHYLGEAGSGAGAKAISRALVAMHTAAAAEAVTLAHGIGIHDMGKLLSVLDTTDGASTMLRQAGPSMSRLLRNPDEIPKMSAMTVDDVLRETAWVPQAESSTGIPPSGLPVLSTARRVFAQTSQVGIGDRDVASVVHFLDGADAGSSAASSDASSLPGVAETDVLHEAPGTGTEFY